MDMKSIFKSNQEKAIAFVEDKYGIEVEPVSYESGGFVSNADIIHCHTEGLDPDNETLLIRIDEENGKTVYKDNYFNYLGRDMLEEHVSAYVTEEFKDIKIYLQNTYFYHSNDINRDSTVADVFSSSPSYWIDVLVFVKADGSTPEEYEERMLAIEKAIKESGDSIKVKLLVINEDLYTDIERYTIKEFWDRVDHRNKADGENIFYIYCEIITD